jgi:peptidoglycan/xylan/chitin deacetylase (PgdA/CDA1 family)
MSSSALVITYHAIEAGPAPLCIEPGTLEEHLEVIGESRVTPVSLQELASRIRQGSGDRCVALTFDDGFASVAEVAAPMLAARGIPATIFCVAGHLGGRNDFATDPPGTPKRRLATAEELAMLDGNGLEVGSHGVDHVPLRSAEGDAATLRREIVESRELLEERLGRPVPWFATPYGDPPGPQGRSLIEQTYEGACGGGTRPVRAGADVHELPRIDAHYVRNPAVLRWVLEGRGVYLPLRRLAGRLRRTVRSDFVSQ